MEQEAKVCAGGCIRNYADPLPHCDDCSFRQSDEKTTDISYERAAEILDPTHREHYDSMNEIEAISVLEPRIKYPNSDTYGGMCEAEYQQEAVVLAIDALREKAEREKGCAHCNDTRCTTCCHFGWSPEICKRCENQDIYKPRPFCQFCGRRLEVGP